MLIPGVRRGNEYRCRSSCAVLDGLSKGGVVLGSQIVAEPDQCLHDSFNHKKTGGRLNAPPWYSVDGELGSDCIEPPSITYRTLSWVLPCAQRVAKVSLFGFKLVSETRKTFITSNLIHVRPLCKANTVQISQNMQIVQKFNSWVILGLS